jgi:hypothetical protein
MKKVFYGLTMAVLLVFAVTPVVKSDWFESIIITDGTSNADVTTENKLQVLSEDWILEVSRGNIPGATIERKFGSIDAIQASTPANVWEYGVTAGAETYTFSTTADIDTISSSSASDTVEMTIIGLDSSYNEVTQNATLNGQNKVTLGTALIRVNRMYNNNGTDLVGNVYCYVDGTITLGVPNTVADVRAYVSAGEGQTLQMIYTTPNGKKTYILGIETSITKGSGATAVTANFRGRTRESGKVFRTQDEFNLMSNGTSNRVYNLETPLCFPGKTDFYPIVDVSANDLGASWAITIVTIDD